MRERLVVVWRVTTRCNLSCPFCAYDRTLAFQRVDANANLITSTGESLAAWSESTGRPVLISWLGGEPLLWPPLADLSAKLHALGLSISTTTNGTPLANPATRRHLLRHYAELTVSVDALPKTHDALRGRAGLFDEIRRHVMTLASEASAAGSPVLLRANVVLMRESIAGFPCLCRELATWGIREITCNQLGGADRPEFFPANRLLPEQVERLQNEWLEMQQELASGGVRLLGGEAYLQRLAASSRGEPLDVADCGPGRRFLFINETGRVAPCSFTGEDYGVPLDELSPAAWRTLPERFSETLRCQRSRHCRDCHSTHVFDKFALPA